MDITIGDTGRTLTLPDHWETLDTLPGDAPGTVAFGFRDLQSYAAVTLGPLDGQMMPVDRDAVIEGIRPALAEAGAELIEVDAGETPGGDLLVYTIVKTPPPESVPGDDGDAEELGDGPQYNLTLNLAVDNGEYLEPFLVQGFFAGFGDDQHDRDEVRLMAERVITAA
ncbi:MAG: hypothetical protein ACTIL2_05300 [Corynebacterium sp.]|uniref:hypothetical protein n=1 Tax=Corynebacterium sp. TaxID=1720 RepID=UPI003F98B622